MTSTSFNELLGSLKSRPTSANIVDPFEEALRDVIHEMNTAPNNDFFRASYRVLVDGSLRRATVSTYPRTLPIERTIMLAFALGQGPPMLPTHAGLGTLNDPTPDGFRAYLREFFASPAFQETLLSYMQRNAESVEGWLHRGNAQRVTLLDARVEIEHTQQLKLAQCAEKGEWNRAITIDATHLPAVGTFKGYEPDAKYPSLTAGGFVMDVTKHERRGDTIVITGTLDADKQPRHLA